MVSIRIERLTYQRSTIWAVELVWTDCPFPGPLGHFDTQAEALAFARAYADRADMVLETAEILPFRKAVA